MSDTNPTAASKFDDFAACYDSALARRLAATGEDRSYFALRRIRWLKQALDSLGIRPENAIEFGCGTGANISLLIDVGGVKSVVGLDVSAASLEFANRLSVSMEARFYLTSEYQPAGDVDLAFCNGVFHHIPPSQRASAASYVRSCLKPGGLFAMWDNNPWKGGAEVQYECVASNLTYVS